MLPAGTHSLFVDFSPVDGANFNSATMSVSITVLPLAVTPNVTMSPSPVQYSDGLTITAVLPVLHGLKPATGLVVTVAGQTAPTAPFSDSGAGISATARSSALLLAPGTYPVVVSFAGVDPSFSVAPYQTMIQVAKEDARATYTGSFFASTASLTSNLATVVLSATIQDISAVPTDPASDSEAGEIQNARVSFISRETGAVLCADLPVGLVIAGDLTTGTATCNCPMNIGQSDSVSYTVGIRVDGYYGRNSSLDDAVLTVSRPYPSSFITGGGHLFLSSSSGLLAGDVNTRSNFGFSVKYNKSGTNLQGRFTSIFRRNGRVYRVKGNAISSLAVQLTATGGKATFTGKASLSDVTDPVNPISVDGNATLQATITDNGEPGNADTIGLTIWNKNGGLYFSSKWTATSTAEQAISGGNLVVR